MFRDPEPRTDELPRRARPRKDKREAILAAARSIVAEEGTRALSIRRVGRKAGVSIGGVYVYFRSIEHLHAALLCDTHRRLLALVRRRLRPVRDPRRALASVGRAYVSVIVEHYETFEQTVRLKFELDADARALPAEAAEELRRGLLGALAPFEAPIRAGQATGLFRTDRTPRRVAAQLWGALHGVVLSFKNDRRLGPAAERRFLVEYAGEVTEALVDALAVKGERT